MCTILQILANEQSVSTCCLIWQNFASIPLKITCTEIELTGERDGIDASFGYYTKGIYVDVGGNLDIHGQEKLSWTKLTETLTPMKPFGLKRFVCN